MSNLKQFDVELIEVTVKRITVFSENENGAINEALHCYKVKTFDFDIEKRYLDLSKIKATQHEDK